MKQTYTIFLFFFIVSDNKLDESVLALAVFSLAAEHKK